MLRRSLDKILIKLSSHNKSFYQQLYNREVFTYEKVFSANLQEKHYIQRNLHIHTTQGIRKTLIFRELIQA